MLRALTSLLSSVLAGVCLAGCIMGRAHIDHPIDEGRLAGLERGVTTKQQVLEWFGPPQLIDAREIVALDDFFGMPGDDNKAEQLVAARYFRYEYTRTNAAIIITGIFNYVDADVKRDTLVIFFDGQDRVADFAFARDTDLLPAMGPLSR